MWTDQDKKKWQHIRDKALYQRGSRLYQAQQNEVIMVDFSKRKLVAKLALKQNGNFYAKDKQLFSKLYQRKMKVVCK